LTREKGADVLLDALAQVCHPAWNAVVFCDGAERLDLERQATRLGVSARVRWQGAVPAVQRFYRAFDVFILSSRTEGIPIVLFEAMSAGVPVVATAVGGVPEVLTDAEARLVASEDARAIAGAIDAVGADHAAATKRAEAARHVLTTRFDPRSWVARYDAMYRRVMKSPGQERAR
jgi:glycosyltransferase involved in cell wall biosynthesis